MLNKKDFHHTEMHDPLRHTDSGVCLMFNRLPVRNPTRIAMEFVNLFDGFLLFSALD